MSDVVLSSGGGEEDMSIRENKKRSKEEAAGGNSDGAPTPKREAKRETGDATDNFFVCELSNSRRLVVRRCRRKIVVEIKRFYMKDGKLRRGKKGIILPLDQWKILCDHIDEINKAVTENA